MPVVNLSRRDIQRYRFPGNGLSEHLPCGGIPGQGLPLLRLKVRSRKRVSLNRWSSGDCSNTSPSRVVLTTKAPMGI